jgi:hypothetical protein
VSGQVSQPCKTTGKIIFLYILIFIFLDRNLENKIFWAEWKQAFPDTNVLLISSSIEFWSVEVFHKCLNSYALSKVLLSNFICWLRPAFWSWDVTVYFVLSAFSSSPVS